ncbi:secondary thiamine-phosphate synthase enzyme [Faunimonas pinastri]|uniref:Secondary thiamine-phosphate synthase enzyme n=1 Tax=Faunimonas pinastri TaxID=1855383 RepID=A0A1H9PR69_9HYPH|nr:secondary thiamine-phosphate synthase enzyme YjbQ [Faunimonas pinastri]SER50315.1 secondary thiamine-phosphate synthase enzyme [Faunimonas pinastri]
MTTTLGPIGETTHGRICRATLAIETRRPGFTEITGELARFLRQAQAGDGLLNVFVRHTSASLTVQENADPDVRTDLMTALDRLAPRDFGWVHDAEGPDDMPAHVRTMVTDASLVLPVAEGRLQLGTWQGIYLIEHRDRPHRRTIVLTYSGS